MKKFLICLLLCALCVSAVVAAPFNLKSTFHDLGKIIDLNEDWYSRGGVAYHTTKAVFLVEDDFDIYTDVGYADVAVKGGLFDSYVKINVHLNPMFDFIVDRSAWAITVEDTDVGYEEVFFADDLRQISPQDIEIIFRGGEADDLIDVFSWDSYSDSENFLIEGVHGEDMLIDVNTYNYWLYN